MQLFKRLKLPEYTISAVLGRLLSDDVYLRATAFPDPAHRSTRLQSQASQLYVILYFSASTLRNDERAMREVVDRYFNDNWVISYYMGTAVDLQHEWSSYPAASAALANTLKSKNVGRQEEENAALMKACAKELRSYLQEVS